MKKNKILYIIGGLAVVGIVGYFIYQKRSNNKKNKSGSPDYTGSGSGSSASTSGSTSTGSNVVSSSTSAKTLIEKARQDSTGNINFDARGIKLIEKRISDFESLINDTFKEKDLSENMKRTLFSTFYRNLKSFREGVKKDNYSDDTKNYANNLMDKFEKFYRNYLPSSEYNKDIDWYVEAEKNIIKKWGSDTDFYNAKVI